MCNCKDSHNIPKIPLNSIESDLTSSNPPKTSADTVSTQVDVSTQDSLGSLNTKLSYKWKNRQSVTKINSMKKIDDSTLDSIIQKHFGDIIKKISSTIEKTEMHAIERDQRKIVENEWSDFALILDRLLFLIFTSLTIISTLSIFFMSPYLNLL